MTTTSLLVIPYTLLFVFASIQLGLVSAMVGFLHIQKTVVKSYHVASQSQGLDFQLHVLPENIMVNQGHTTNGAAGYGVVLSLAGFLLVYLGPRFRSQRRYKLLLTHTILLSLLSLLTLSAFIYTFSVTYQTNQQTIDVAVASTLGPDTAYALDSWTPETWYRAVLQLPLQEVSLSAHYDEMVAWRWWILPYFVVASFVTAWCALATLSERRAASMPYVRKR